MIATDVVVLLALAVALVAWWMRGFSARSLVLTISGLAALGAGVAGFLMGRWQDGAGAAVALVLLLILLVNRLRKASTPKNLPLFTGPLFTLAVAGAVVAVVMFPVDALPRPTGQYPVGVRTFEIDDASRPGLFAAKPTEPRRLLVRVWYPAGETKGLRRSPYFNQREAETTARSVGQLLGMPWFFSYVKFVETNSFEDAPLLPAAKNLPVVFYSHGYTSYLSQNTALMEQLASHGYIVFSVQHTYDSVDTLFPNGDVVPTDPDMFAGASSKLPQSQIDAMGGPTPPVRLNGFINYRMERIAGHERTVTRSARVWVQDRLFLHDQLQAGAVPEPIREIAAAGDLAHVGEMGMSFGGAISGTICMTDPRCAAGINLDGGDLIFTAFNADMPVPFMMFHSDLATAYANVDRKPEGPLRSFNEFSYERIATSGSRPDIYRVMLKGAEHLGLSDNSRFIRRPLSDPLFGYTPSHILIGAQNDFVLGFFDKHLRHAGTTFPAPQLATYKDWMTRLDTSDLRGWWAGLPEAERASYESRITAARDALPAAPPH